MTVMGGAPVSPLQWLAKMAEARRINVSGKADDINERNPETLKDRGK